MEYRVEYEYELYDARGWDVHSDGLTEIEALSLVDKLKGELLQSLSEHGYDLGDRSVDSFFRIRESDEFGVYW